MRLILDILWYMIIIFTILVGWWTYVLSAISNVLVSTSTMAFGHLSTLVIVNIPYHHITDWHKVNTAFSWHYWSLRPLYCSCGIQCIFMWWFSLLEISDPHGSFICNGRACYKKVFVILVLPFYVSAAVSRNWMINVFVSWISHLDWPTIR